jgi:[protein-PII] uridylyltransferase
MNESAASIRQFLETGRQAVAAQHRAGDDGRAIAQALTRLTDSALTTAFAQGVPAPLQNHCAIIAVGGYGRNELCPHSDIDVMLLCDASVPRNDRQKAATGFLHILWDAGLTIGHSVRTTDEALALKGQTLDAWTSILESRLICGNTATADELEKALTSVCGPKPDAWLVHGVLDDVRGRHERFGNSVKLLEPNIKKSAGGLRDLHALVWLYRGLPGGIPVFPSTRTTVTEALITSLQTAGVLGQDDGAKLLDAFAFLLRVRHEMHFLRGMSDDTLEYALQRDVAAGLGYGDQEAKRSVEVFMTEYYNHARTIYKLHTSLIHRFELEVMPAPPVQSSRLFRFAATLFSGTAAAPAAEPRQLSSAEEIFTLFCTSAESGGDLDFETRAAIERNLELIQPNDRFSPVLADKFRRILRSSRVGVTLRGMAETGVLGRYIPEFEALVAFFQHNVYHYYTADEHTLIAIANAERLNETQGPLGDVFRAVPERETFFLALLLHDIAKPLGVADHEVTGVEIARTVLDRLGATALFDDIAFLVRHHLLMEQTAFRRNVHDPATLRDFASRFSRPVLLDYLYLLTYADLSAVNPGVWTEWKSALLHDLYWQTAEVLRRDLHGVEIEKFQADQRAVAVADVSEALSGAIPRDVTSMHLDAISGDAYPAVFSPEEIAGHIRAINALDDVTTLFNHHGSFTDVTVIGHDAPFALSRFCAVLAANDANIFDASIFTRDDGVVIDRFRVSSTATHKQIEQHVCTKIEEDLRAMVAGNLDPVTLFSTHHRKWRRRRHQAQANPNIRTDVTFEATPDYTIIDVYAPDSVGFLYRVTETISRLGLDIYFAKIATRVDGIVDAFYVLDRSGAPVSDHDRQAAIRESILQAISDSTELTAA